MRSEGRQGRNWRPSLFDYLNRPVAEDIEKRAVVELGDQEALFATRVKGKWCWNAFVEEDGDAAAVVADEFHGSDQPPAFNRYGDGVAFLHAGTKIILFACFPKMMWRTGFTEVLFTIVATVHESQRDRMTAPASNLGIVALGLPML